MCVNCDKWENDVPVEEVFNIVYLVDNLYQCKWCKKYFNDNCEELSNFYDFRKAYLYEIVNFLISKLGGN